MKRIVSVAGAAAVLLTLSMGCDSMSGPEQACNDFIIWVGDTASRCGGESARQPTEDALHQQLNCGAVKQVRDEPGLRGCCHDFYQKLECAVMISPNFSDAIPTCCKDQLLF
jgi:hypothetical protein